MSGATEQALQIEAVVIDDLAEDIPTKQGISEDFAINNNTSSTIKQLGIVHDDKAVSNTIINGFSEEYSQSAVGRENESQLSTTLSTSGDASKSESIEDKLSDGNHNEACTDNSSGSSEFNDLKNLAETSTEVTLNNLTTSSVSLNEQILLEQNTVLNKTPFSRSAENISSITSTQTQSLTSSTKDLDTKEILAQFNNKKTVVSATQQIVQDNPPNVDSRYSKLPKEMIAPDIGSIVKNVHGIFNSVSGSLKHAYNHRAAIPRPSPKQIKTLPNGKLMQDIFEDESTTNDQNKENNSPPIPIPNSNSDVKPKSLNNYEGSDSEKDAGKEVLRLQIDSLEKMLAEQRKENGSIRERVKVQTDELQEKDTTFKELEAKMDLMCKRMEQAEREKDAAVMRYASVECTAIEAKRQAERASAAERAALNEVELLNNKLKSAHSEKHRICQMYDDKCHELLGSERELTKLKEDMKEMEGRLKWTQSKLRCEMDAYKESNERAEKLSKQVSELEAAKDAAVANAADSVRAKQLEQELKESQAALILSRHEMLEIEKRLSSCSQELETCKSERDEATSKLSLSTAEVCELQSRCGSLEQEAAELAALRAQAALADTLNTQLERERARSSQYLSEVISERARADTCARREAAALQHAAALTHTHVHDATSQARYRAKEQALTMDNVGLRERVTSLEAECLRLQTALTDETQLRNKENKLLARKVAELTEELSEANKNLEWERGENAILKKKHASAIKELNRELSRSLKRCEQLEAKLPTEEPSTRTGSVSSLSSGESAAHDDRLALHNGHAATDTVPDVQTREPDRQALVERIVSLQRQAARRSERCDFLEEHSRALTAELRRKGSLLRHLLTTIAPHHLATQKELSQLGGGAMSALWGGDRSGITLELSLDVNKKLQALLEDTLLKNITLKENMDTLGEEISRLKEQAKTQQNETK